VLGQEFPDTQGRLAWSIVVVQNPGTGRPFVKPFPTNCISKALQNGYVDSLIHDVALGKKLVVNQSLRVKESDQHCFAIFKPGIPLKYLGPTQRCFSECLL
jgi:hypothetical protein